jgi:hypothetical protein
MGVRGRWGAYQRRILTAATISKFANLLIVKGWMALVKWGSGVGTEVGSEVEVGG